MTAPDTLELRRKAEAATPGPWFAGHKQPEDDYGAPGGVTVGPYNTEERWGRRPDYSPERFGNHYEETIADVMEGNHDSVANAAFIAAANPAVILALLDRLDALEAHGVWWKTVIGEGDAHQPSGEIRSIKHMHPLMVKPFYEAHKGDAIGDIIAGLIFNLEITQNRETLLVEDANERRKAAEGALEEHLRKAPTTLADEGRDQ